MKSKLLLGFLLVALMCVRFTTAEEKAGAAETAKRADIKKIMEITGAGDIGIQVMNQMIATFKKGNTEIPEKFWKDLKSEFNPNDLIELCIPIYEKHFTHDEIKQLLAFYETPVGKKMIKKLPIIMQESMKAGENWGRKIADKIIKKLENEGY